MRRYVRAVVVGYVLALALGLWVAQAGSERAARAAAAQAAQANLQQGEQVYQAQCAKCHGVGGIGALEGPSLHGIPNDPAEIAGVEEIVREGLGKMDPFRDKLSDPQTSAVATYVVSRFGTAGQAADGGVLYRLNCAGCHGAAGRGGALIYSDKNAPQLRDVSGPETVAAIRSGPGEMPAFNLEALSDEQVASIVEYVHALQEPPTDTRIDVIHPGPVTEGLIAVVVGLGAAMLAAVWGRAGRAWLTIMAEKPGTHRSSTFGPVAATVVAAGAAVGTTVAYWAGGDPRFFGGLGALSLLALGIGLVSWSRAAMPDEVVSGPRGQLSSSEEDRAQFVTEFVRGEESIGRRKLLGGLLLTVAAGLAAAMASMSRSLGPAPLPILRRTSWRRGMRIVVADGTPLKADALRIGSVLTVYPEGHVGEADAQTLLIRVRPGELELPPERLAETHQGIVAYSKVCTHTGCPVGLYQEEQKLLLCPCHQSTFDVLRGATPTSGPAARPLPQLPIDVDEQGFFVATGDFPTPVGPGFWSLPK